MGKLSGKIAVVTGAAQGIGAGVVKRFLEDGVDAVAIDDFSAKKDGIKGRKATYTCNCSRDYLKQVLTSLGEAQMRAIIREDGAVRVHCHYCNTDYVFTKSDEEILFPNN